MGYDGTSVLEYVGKTHQTPLLTDREKQLIGLAVTMTRGCQVCTRGGLRSHVNPASETTCSMP